MPVRQEGESNLEEFDTVAFNRVCKELKSFQVPCINKMIKSLSTFCPSKR
jgi:hypothetical protein